VTVEDHRGDDHAPQDLMLTGLVLALTLTRSGNGPIPTSTTREIGAKNGQRKTKDCVRLI